MITSHKSINPTNCLIQTEYRLIKALTLFLTFRPISFEERTKIKTRYYCNTSKKWLYPNGIYLTSIHILVTYTLIIKYDIKPWNSLSEISTKLLVCHRVTSMTTNHTYKETRRNLIGIVFRKIYTNKAKSLNKAWATRGPWIYSGKAA